MHGVPSPISLEDSNCSLVAGRSVVPCLKYRENHDWQDYAKGWFQEPGLTWPEGVVDGASGTLSDMSSCILIYLRALMVGAGFLCS